MNETKNISHQEVTPPIMAQSISLGWKETIFARISFIFTCITSWFRKEIDVKQGPIAVWKKIGDANRPLKVLNWINDQGRPNLNWSDAKQLNAVSNDFATTANHFLSTKPNTFDNFINETINTNTDASKNKDDIFLICIDTQYHGGKHAVGILINPEQKEIVFLDSKGHNPNELYLVSKEDNLLTCMDVIHKVLPMTAEVRSWSVHYTPNWQKPNDCVICMAAMAKMATTTPKGQSMVPHLQTEINKMVRNYSEIDQIRKEILQTKKR